MDRLGLPRLGIGYRPGFRINRLGKEPRTDSRNAEWLLDNQSVLLGMRNKDYQARLVGYLTPVLAGNPGAGAEGELR